jgi:hypothetical protein
MIMIFLLLAFLCQYTAPSVKRVNFLSALIMEFLSLDQMLDSRNVSYLFFVLNKTETIKIFLKFDDNDFSFSVISLPVYYDFS